MDWIGTRGFAGGGAQDWYQVDTEQPKAKSAASRKVHIGALYVLS